MAKQRKLLYSSDPNSFFDEMEREVNSTKRKKCKKGNPEPPEKLFLQFDPSKKEDVYSSKNMVNSQPLLMQKTQWKPPIKILSYPESSESSKNTVPENNDKNKGNIYSKSNKNMAKVDFPNNDNNLKITDNSLDENRSENRKYAEEDEGNATVIISSPDSSEQNSPEIVPSDHGHNKCLKHENSNETTGETVIFDEKTETVVQEVQDCEENTVINTYQKEDNMAVAENCLQRLSTDAYCNFETKEPSSPTRNLSTYCHDLNAVMSEGECPDISMGKISKLRDTNNLNEPSDAFDERKLSPKEDILKEELIIEIGQPYNNNNLQPTQCSGKSESQIFELKPLKIDLTANIKKSDELKIINSSDDSVERKLSPKGEFVMEEGDTEIGQQNNNDNLDPIQCNGKVKFQIVEIPRTTDMTANTEKFDKSEIVNENYASKTGGIYFAPETSKNNINKIQDLNEIAQIDTVQFDSVFEDPSPTEIQNSPKLEIAIEPNEGKLSSIVLCNVSMPENSWITTELESDNYTAVDTNSQNILPINNDNNVSVNQNSELESNNTIIKVYENLEINSNIVGEYERNVNKEDEHLTKDCSIQNNDTLEKDFNLKEIDEGEKDGNTNDFEQLLEVENKIQEENVDRDEDYSCLMISNSQLAEIEKIEKNYCESSQHTVANEVSKVSDTKYGQFNQLRHNENKIDCNHSKTEGKFDSVNLIGFQTKVFSQNSSDSTFRNIVPPNLPRVQWPKNMLEMQKKIRDLTREIEHVNSLLLGFRREIWPQKHGDNPNN